MAIAFDAASSGNNGGSGTLTISHTCASGVVLCVFLVSDPNGGGGSAPSTATYAGAALSLVTSVARSSGRTLYAYYLANPATGANNIVFGIAGGAYGLAAAASYTGVNTSGQPEANATAGSDSASSLTGSVTTVTDNAWAIMGGGHESGSIAAGTGSTKRASESLGICGVFDSNAAVHPAGSNSMQYTAGGTYFCNMILLSLAPAPAASSFLGNDPAHMPHHQALMAM